MKIDIKKLKENDKFKDLDDSVLNAFITLAHNKEKIAVGEAIDTTFGEVKAQLKSAGIEGELDKLGSIGTVVKTYVEDKTNTSDIQGKLDKLQAEYDDLKKKGSSDELLKKQVKDLEGEISSLKDIHKKSKDDHKKALETKDLEYGSKIQSLEIGAAISGLKYRDDIDEDLRALKIEKVTNSTLSKYQKETRGGKEVWINKETGKPEYHEDTMEIKAIAEIIKPNLASILKVEKDGSGTGGKGADAKGNPSALDFGQYSNKNEANNAIFEHVKNEGVPTGTAEFNKAVYDLTQVPEYEQLP